MYRILIAEDELIERTVLKKTLHKKLGENCEILEAENGREALHIFRSTDVHIVILDIEMPGIKGLEVAEIMRKEKKGFCIIFLTAYDKFEYAKRAIAVRAMEYLLKPYSDKELIGVVEEALHLFQKQENQLEKAQDAELEETYLIECRQIGRNEGETASEFDEGNVTRLSVLVSMVEDYIKNNYRKEITMQDAARAVNYSEPYFCKVFKQQYGQNFTAYLKEFRVEEAKKLLRQPDVNVKEIGKRVGYPDSNYFARVFRGITGESPTEYRMRFLKQL